MDAHIITLQEIIAHHEQDIERLSHELYTQQKDIIRLQKIVTGLCEKIETLSHNLPAEQDSPPPHY